EARRPQSPRPEARRTQEPQRAEEPGRTGETRTSDEPRRPAQDPPPRRAPRTGDSERLAKDAAAYYTVAKRRVDSVNLIPRILRSLRDALLIGVSLIAIWAVLAAAGIPIPFTTVLIVVAAIVAVSFGVGVYAQWKRSREALDAVEDPSDPAPEADARSIRTSETATRPTDARGAGTAGADGRRAGTCRAEVRRTAPQESDLRHGHSGRDGPTLERSLL